MSRRAYGNTRALEAVYEEEKEGEANKSKKGRADRICRKRKGWNLVQVPKVSGTV
jgi:hypothetical protein